jgi:hypothetical protein
LRRSAFGFLSEAAMLCFTFHTDSSGYLQEISILPRSHRKHDKLPTSTPSQRAHRRDPSRHEDGEVEGTTSGEDSDIKQHQHSSSINRKSTALRRRPYTGPVARIVQRSTFRILRAEYQREVASASSNIRSQQSRAPAAASQHRVHYALLHLQ